MKKNQTIIVGLCATWAMTCGPAQVYAQVSGVAGDGIPDVYYFATTGQVESSLGPIIRPGGVLMLDTDGVAHDIVAILVGGPNALAGCDLCAGMNLPTQSPAHSQWTVGYSGGSTQWIRTSPLSGDGFKGVVGTAYYDAADQLQAWPGDGGGLDFPDAGLANYGPGLTAGSFNEVFDDGVNTWSVLLATDAGDQVYTHVTVVDAPPDYTLSIDAPAAVYGAPGATVEFTANVQLTVADGAEPVGGFSLGVAHDGPGACEILQGVQGPALTALNGGAGPDFANLQLFAEGFTAGAVFSFDGLAVLQSGVHTLLELAVEATIPPSGCVNCSLDIIDTLGLPPVSVIVVINGASVAPVTIDGDTLRCEGVGPVCGNGIVDTDEQCDDANQAPGDGCTANCLIEVSADNCGGAATIREGLTGFSTIGTTTDGSPDPLCDNAGTDDIGQDIWFNYTAPASGELTVSTCEELGGWADFDTRIAVYSACSCPPAAAMGCNDDDPINDCGTGAGGFHSTLTVPVNAGMCYNIRVGGFGGEAGTGTLLLDLTQYGDPIAAELIAAVGQELPGEPGAVITELNAPFTNGLGEVGFTGTTNNSSDGFVWYDDQAVWRNSDADSYSLAFAEATMGVGDDGRWAYSPSVNGNDAVLTGFLGVGTPLLAAGDEIFGAFSTFNSRPMMTADGTTYWIGGLAISPGGSTAGRALFRCPTEFPQDIEVVQATGDVVDGFTISHLDFNYQMSDNHAHRIHRLFLANGMADSDVAVSVNDAIVARETMPTGQGDNWASFDAVAINNSGHYLFSGKTDGASTADEFIAYDGTIVIREGDVLDGIELPTGADVKALSINNLGIAVHIWGKADLGSSDEYLFVGDAADLAVSSRKLLGVGDPVDLDDDGTVDATIADIHGSTDIGPAVSIAEDGFIFVDLSLVNIGSLDAYEAIVRLPLDLETPCGAEPCSSVLYVDSLATPGGYGGSWEAALPHLQDALALARGTNPSGEQPVFSEIRVAQGTYRPDGGVGRLAAGTFVAGTLDAEATFALASDVLIRGGYCGVNPACTDPDDQDRGAYETILSGDLQDDDDWTGFPTASGTDNNVKSIVSALEIGGTTLEDLTVLHGGQGIELDEALNGPFGGGLRAESMSNLICSGVDFVENVAFLGGGAYVHQSSVLFERCTFLRNIGVQGGGVSGNIGSSMDLQDSVFDENVTLEFDFHTSAGAGVSVSAADHLAIDDCVFMNNMAVAGAQSSLGGGVRVYGTLSLAVANCQFGPGNAAGYGGAMSLSNDRDIQDSYVLAHNKIYENTAVMGGGVHINYLAGTGPLRVDATSSHFEQNHAAEDGGGLMVENRVELQGANLLFTDNSAGLAGGAIAVTGDANVFLGSSTLADNPAPTAGGVDFQGEVLAFYNSIAWANPGGDILVSNELLFDGWAAIFGEAGDWPGLPDVQAVDPGFTDPANGDYTLAPGSPAIDTGHNGLVWPDVFDLDGDGDADEPLPLDLAGDARFSDDIGVTDDGQGTAPIVDLGAFERTAPSCSALVAYDAFDNGVLDTRWDPVVTEGVTWVAEESAGRLLVTDFVGVPLMDSGTAVLALDVPPTGDFTLEAEVSWDSEGTVAAMQRVLVSLYGANTLVGEAGLVDGWLGSAGGYRVVAGDNAAPTLPDTAPLSNDTVFTIQRSGTAVEVYENGALLQSGQSSIPIDRVQLYFQHDNFTGSLFGTVEIHHIQLTADPVADCNDNGLPDDCDIAGGNSLDEDGNGVPDECVGGACVILADCADLDDDGVRDDNCMWWTCGSDGCAGTEIVFGDMAGQFGACPPDGTADGNDRFAALNCFANTDPNVPGASFPCEDDAPAAFNVDAGGQFGSCAPDGVCDGNDAFAALNAFAGTTPCSCPLDGAPSPVIEPVTVATAALELHGSRTEVRPGDLVEIEVHLATPLADLRGYQLHLGVSGGDRGTLELVDIGIARPGVFADTADPVSRDRRPALDDRRAARDGQPTAQHTIAKSEVDAESESAAVPGGVWVAFNKATGQMLAGMDTPGLAVEPGYLVTFAYRASKDARGSFAIDVLADPNAADHRTYLFPTRPNTRIAIDVERGVLVEVR